MMGGRSGFAPTFLPKSGEELGPWTHRQRCHLFLFVIELTDVYIEIFGQDDIRDVLLRGDIDMFLDIIFMCILVDIFLNVLLGVFQNVYEGGKKHEQYR
ncbi:hypothetical protein ACN38_g9188 [Penicillium nordicum]|uniref:Uncharacterized protein n=1 Tax=Penicillium nordicum TaxID=229535 RepID=A0A0M9WCT9_9EURO|nr:hypothetical protein ACN38_g9188 [Penicillium nordicum]